MALLSEKVALLVIGTVTAILAFFLSFIFLLLIGFPFGILLVVPFYLFVGAFDFWFLEKVGIMINNYFDIAKRSVIIFAIAVVICLLFFYLGHMATCSMLLSTDSCDIPEHTFDALDPFYPARCVGPPGTDMGCGLRMLYIWGLRYFVYLGPHNPISLFIGGYLYLKWKIKKEMKSN